MKEKKRSKESLKSATRDSIMGGRATTKKTRPKRAITRDPEVPLVVGEK